MREEHKIEDNKIKAFINLLKKNKFKIFDITEIDWGIKINSVYKSEYKVKFNIYKSKKGYSIHINKDLSLNDQLISEIENIIYSNFNIIFSNLIFIKNSIGTDEAGKGDFFGPLVVAGVYLDDESYKEITKLKLLESKSASMDFILRSFEKLKDKVIFECIVLTPSEFNKIYKETNNINIILKLLHLIVIRKLKKRLDKNMKMINAIIIDDFMGKTEKSFFKEKLKNLQQNNMKEEIKLIIEHKAEKYINVLIASIIAKAVYLIELKKLSDRYNINFPRGTNKKVKESAIKFIENYEKDELNKVVKVNFSTYKDIFNNL